MSRQSFITRGPIPANMNGIELTEQRFAVDRFYHPDDGAAAYLTDNSADIAALTGAALAGNVLTISGNVAPTTAGNYNVIDRTVIIDGTGAALTSGGAGVHINLINCQIDVRNGPSSPLTAFGSWPNAGNATERVEETFTNIANPTQAQLTTARGAARSLNLYGCSINVRDTANSRFFSPSDMFDCEIDFASDSAVSPGALFGTTTNGRWVRLALRKVVDANTANQAARTNPYGILRQLAAPVFDGYGIRQGNTGYDTTLIVDEPNFPNSRQVSFYNMNVPPLPGTSTPDPDQPIQVIGGPSLGTVDEAWGVTNGSGTDPGLISGASANSFSGVLTTVADKRRFFSDPLLTTGAEGIILRTRVNVVPSVFGTTGDWTERAQALAGRTPTASRDVIVDYITNADGLWSSMRYSADGGFSFLDGYVDWFFWDPRTATGTTTLATAWSNNSAPPGTVLIPVQNAYGVVNTDTAGSKELTAYSAETEIRSLVWDVVEASNVYTIPPAGEPLRVTTGNNVVVRDPTVVATSLDAANTPFNTVSAKTFQQLSDKAKHDWALFDLDELRATTGGDLTWTGGITVSNNDVNTTLTGANITFNRVASLGGSEDPINGINVSAGLIMAVPFGGRFTAGTSINAGNQNTEITDITTPTINNWSVTATHGATTINGATTVNLTNASGTVLSSTLFGSDEPAGTGTITLNADAPVIVQVQDTGNTRFAAGTDVMIQQAPPAPVLYTITPELLPGSNGRFLIKEVGGNVVNTRTITNGVVDGTDFSVDSMSTTQYIAYYKLDGVFGVGTTVDYQIAIRQFTGTALSANLAIAPLAFPAVFTNPLNMPTTQVASLVASTADNIRMNWSGDVVDNAELTASNIIVAKNSDAWIDWHAANDFTVEYYSLGDSSSGSWNNAVTGISGVTSTQGVIFRSNTGAQRQVTQQSGFNTVGAGTAPNTYNEVINANVGNAPIPVVIAAVDSSAVASNVDTINTNVTNVASDVTQVRRGVGYTIDGIFPARGNPNGAYSNTGDYGDDL